MTQSDSRLLSLIFLSFAVLVRFGSLTSAALFCAVLSATFAIVSLSSRCWGPPPRRFVWPGLVILLAATTVLYNRRLQGAVSIETFAVTATAIVLFLLVKHVAARILAVALGACAAGLEIASNFTWGFFDIDVFHLQQNAAQALLSGQNPYTPVAMGPQQVAQGVYKEIPLHLPYGPAVPILEAPLQWLGDIRILHILAAVAIAAAVLVLARRAGTLDRAAGVVMAFPLTVGMVLFSWVDILTMAGLAVWMVLFRSHPRIATVALVLALGTKPTALIALVPIFFWSVRARRQVLIAGLVTALVSVPFAVATGVAQFYYDVLGLHIAGFSRYDSLTVNSMLDLLGLPVIPAAVAAAVVCITTFLVLRRRPDTYGDLLAGTAIIVTVSFLLAKWAYFNYYYIAAVLLMLAIAGDNLALDSAEMIRPPALCSAAARGLRRRLGRGAGTGRVPGLALPGHEAHEPAA